MAVHDRNTARVTDAIVIAPYSFLKLDVQGREREESDTLIHHDIDMEPFRTATAMAAHSVRAGSALPTATEKIPATDLTMEQLDGWRKWQKREEKVQGVIRTTVSDWIVIDIVDVNSAKQMWDYILATHQLDSPEEQAQVRDALATIRLKDDPSAEEMGTRNERFNSFLLSAQGLQASRLMRRKGLNAS
jgi:hypothetical protein